MKLTHIALGASSLLTALLLGCTPTPQPAPLRTYDLQAIDRARLTQLQAEAHNTHSFTLPSSPQRTNAVPRATDTLTTPTNAPTRETLSFSFPLYSPTHPACFNTNHVDLAQRMREATIGYGMLSNKVTRLEGSNAVLRTKLTLQVGKTAQAEEHARREAELAQLQQHNYARLQGIHEKARQTFELQQKQLTLLQEREAHRVREAQDYHASRIAQGRELDAIHTLLNTPGYQIPGSPLVTAQVQGNRLAQVRTYHFSFPSLVTDTAQLEQIVTNLASLYHPTTASGKFKEWLGHAELSPTNFPSYKSKQKEYDSFAELAFRYANAQRTLISGVVFYVDGKNQTNIIAPEPAFKKWMEQKK